MSTNERYLLGWYDDYDDDGGGGTRSHRTDRTNRERYHYKFSPLAIFRRTGNFGILVSGMTNLPYHQHDPRLSSAAAYPTYPYKPEETAEAEKESNTLFDSAYTDLSGNTFVTIRIPPRPQPRTTTGQQQQQQQQPPLPTETLTRTPPSLAQRTGRWSLDEKILFLYGLRKFGKGRWKKISIYLPKR